MRDLEVMLPALDRAGRRHADTQSLCERIVTLWEEAVVPQGCMGKLGESEQVEAELRGVHEESGPVIEKLADLSGDFSDRLGSVRDGYLSVEDDLVRHFQSAESVVETMGGAR